MESPADHQWFLRKHADGSIFGPLTFTQLAEWAAAAQIAPHDVISTDQISWIKAPMLPELAMDWIVELTSERLYGPTTLGAIRDFLQLGEITEDTFVINACDATRQPIREIMPLLADLPSTAAEESNAVAAVTDTSAAGEGDRMRELEEALHAEQLARAEIEERYRELEQRYNELVSAAAASTP